MDEPERKRQGLLGWLRGRSRRFWIGVAIVLPLLYVTSFGPACWMVAQPIRDGMQPTAPSRVYWPLGHFAQGESAIGLRLRWWIIAGVPKGWATVVPTGASESRAYFAD